jgi:hypothetical protein
MNRPGRFPVSVFSCLSFCTCLGLNRWRPCVGICIRGMVFGVGSTLVLMQSDFRKTIVSLLLMSVLLR